MPLVMLQSGAIVRTDHVPDGAVVVEEVSARDQALAVMQMRAAKPPTESVAAVPPHIPRGRSRYGF